MKTLKYGLALLLVLLQYQLWFAAGGVRQAWGMRATVQVAQEQNHLLVEKNDILQADINDLQAGTSAVEERARNELGMVKQGEVFLQVVR